MSISFYDPSPRSSRAAFQRQVWARFFGDLIRSAREERTLSVEEVARAAGMPASEWEAMEAGTVPRSLGQLRAVAAGLGIEWVDFAGVVILCRQAWGGSYEGLDPLTGSSYS